MIAYASRTGTRRNLDALRGAGWRLMISATGVHRHEGFPYAIDNGAWTAFVQKTEWDESAFLKLLDSHGSGADFVVVPDIVAGGLESLARSVAWLERLEDIGGLPRLLIPVQDGMTAEHIRPLLTDPAATMRYEKGAWRPWRGIFVGGSTEWKLLTMGRWADLARECGSYCHVGRVNTATRIRMCGRFRVDSFDGSSASRFAETLPELEAARRFWTAQSTFLPSAKEVR